MSNQKVKSSGESWVYFDQKLLKLWNYFVYKPGALTNTRLLFQYAARPHFDFFLSQITNIVMSDIKDIFFIEDCKLKEFFLNRQNQIRNVNTLSVKLEAIKKLNKVLFLTSKGKSSRLEGFNNLKILRINNHDKFGNIEPYWRSIRKKINKESFDAVLVNLDEEKVFIIPRLAMVYKKEILDASIFCINSTIPTMNLWQKLKIKWYYYTNH